MKKFDVTTLFIFIAGCELVGALSALTAGGGFGVVYAALTKPPFTPPPMVFPVVWAILYALMGAAAYIVYLSYHALRKRALTTFGVQLFVNFLYSPVFFGAGSVIGGLAVSAALMAAVGYTVYLFAKVGRPAALLTAPYLIWTAFALYLSAGIAYLNL